jgi:tyrosinase
MAIRRNIAGASATDVQALRDAFGRSYEIGDDRGYAYYAGLHGLPLPSYCEHGTNLFLPWHRAYLYMFERSLQDHTPAAALAWWDWSSATSHQTGVPTALRAPARGGAANPLAAGPVTLNASDLARVRAALPGAITAGRAPRTIRDPDIPDELPRASTVQRALRARTFNEFSALLEGIHNSVHGWVGGAMSAVPVSAYDPIFWAHHTQIDRLWYLWQIGPNGVDPPVSLLGRPLPPFPMTVRDVLDITPLGYGYAVASVG